MATVVEKSKISPPPESLPELSLPIVFFDLLWYDFGAFRGVFFFTIPAGSNSDFLVSDLKESLSLTLAHFLPLAGNIIHPLKPGDKPILRYESGDSLCFTVSESSADFNHLRGNHSRSCDEFYSFAPELPPATRSENSISCPVLALQVTLFPGQPGLCIGFVGHHGAADASTVVSFFQAWALINRRRRCCMDSNNNNNNNISALLTEANLLPFYDRLTVAANLSWLEPIYWEPIVKKPSPPVEPPPLKFPINRLQTTFVLKKDKIEKLKNLVLANYPAAAHLSSFTVSCALVWACLAESAGEEVADDEPEFFGFLADCRGRVLKPPLPPNYFGNCVALVKTELKHKQVKGRQGFVMAAQAIGDAIKENVYNEDEKGILFGAEKWLEEYEELTGKRQCAVSGSPRFDFYAVDYGWGKPAKYEALFDGGGGSMSLSRSRDFEGGLEIGLSKPMLQMDAFATVFTQLLTDLLHS